VFGQPYEYVYKNSSDSSYNCYLKILPETKTVSGLVIRDFSSLPDMKRPSPYRLYTLCSQKGIMTIYTVSSNSFPEFFCSDSAMYRLDEMVAEVVKKHNIPNENIFIGGISASGTRAFRYAQFCEQGKSRYGIKINGVFAADPPLDLARFYQSVVEHGQYFKAGMLEEANLMKVVFPKLFKGPPAQNKKAFQDASVFTHDDSQGGNAGLLKNVDIIIYHEPDIDWWLEERGASYYDINSFDVAAFAVKLKNLGNTDVTIVTTSGRGFDSKGKRNCHSWTIVNEDELFAWLIARLR